MADEDVQIVDTEGTAEAASDGEQSTESSESTAWPADVQAEFTRKTQALADERKQWTTERTNQQQQMQQYAQQVQQYAQQQQQHQQQQHTQSQQGQQQTMLDQLRQMPYLDGNTAAQMMERILGEGITPLQQQLQQRDQALAHMYKEHRALRDSVGQTRNKSVESDLNGRFEALRKEHNLPDEPWVSEYMREIYYSHEGNDLDTAYPEMLRTRLETLRKGFRAMDRQTAQKAKSSPLPFKGGESSLTGKSGGYKTSKERADELWPQLNPGSDE